MTTEMMSRFGSGSGFSVDVGAVFFALVLWIGMIFKRYCDWHRLIS